MSLPAPGFPIQLVRSATWAAGAVDYVPITLSGDPIDLTDPEGVTGGYSCRAIKVGSTAGNVVFISLRGEERTYPAAAGEVIQCGACVIAGSGDGTSATPVGVLL